MIPVKTKLIPLSTENVIEIAKYLKEVGAKKYVLQKYFDHDKSVIPYSNEKMNEMKDECCKILPTVMRGI